MVNVSLRGFVVLAVLALMSSFSLANAQESATLALNLSPGQKFTYQLTIKAPTQVSVSSLSLLSQEVQSEIQITYHYTVLDRQEDKYLLELVVDRYVMDQKLMGQNLHLDTDSEATDELTTQMKQQVNRPIKVWYNKHFEPLGEPMSETGQETDVFDDIMRPNFYGLSPLKVGTSRTLTSYPLARQNKDGNGAYKGTLLLKSVAPDQYVLESTGEANVQSKVEQKVWMKGGMTDTIVIDRQTGMLKSVEGQGAFKGRLAIPDTMDLNFDMKTTTILKQL